MTKKHYIQIANVLALTRPKKTLVCYANWYEIRERLADILASDNPRFDRQKFIDATEEPST